MSGQWWALLTFAPIRPNVPAWTARASLYRSPSGVRAGSGLASEVAVMEPPPESDDILHLYPPDLLPLHRPEEGDTTDLPAAGPGDARIDHLRRGAVFHGFSVEETRRVAHKPRH